MFTIADAGGTMVIRRYLPDLLARAPQQARPLLYRSLVAKFLMVVLFAVLIPFVPDPLMYGLALTAAVFATLLDSVQASLYAGGALYAYAAIPALSAALKLGFILLLVTSLERVGIATALLLAPFVLLLLFTPRAFRLLPSSAVTLEKGYWQFLRFGLLSYSADLAFVLSNRVALVAARHTVGDMAQLGFLGVAFMVYLMMRQLTFFIGETSIPTLVRYHVAGEQLQFARTIHHVWRYTNVLVFFAGLVLMLYAEPILSVVTGTAFRSSARPTQLLVPALIAATLTLCLRIPLFAEERAKRLLISHGAAFIALVITLGAISSFRESAMSINTVAVVFSISTTIGLITMAVLTSMPVRATKLIFSLLKPALAAGVTYAVISLLPHEELAHLAATIPLAIVVYIVLLWIMHGLEFRDWDRFQALIGRRPGDWA
jgi:O-antigen/teichoic acid export membrane protein